MGLNNRRNYTIISITDVTTGQTTSSTTSSRRNNSNYRTNKKLSATKVTMNFSIGGTASVTNDGTKASNKLRNANR